ncbi:MAG TPA: class I SAM-dependent methyltransferase, partial [Bacteroidales bacterium]|nr:class I SAM-dependent methyltransferase [Bacteroidales bacterium]
MDLMDYVIEFHKDAERQGPGNGEATRKALQYIPELGKNARILDIGCGTGAQTMVPTKNTKAQIIAVDMLQEFLDKLQEKIDRKNLSNRVVIKQGLMDNLDFQEKSFDVIWSEGAIYNIGFEKGLLEWKKYLKDNGYIVVSEISWLTDNRPKEIEEYWANAYPEIDTIDMEATAEELREIE